MKRIILAGALAVAVPIASHPCRADSFIVMGATPVTESPAHLVTMDNTTREVTDHVYDLVKNSNIAVGRGQLPVLGPNFAPAGIALTDDVRWPVAIWMFDRVTGATKVCRATTGNVFQCN